MPVISSKAFKTWLEVFNDLQASCEIIQMNLCADKFLQAVTNEGSLNVAKALVNFSGSAIAFARHNDDGSTLIELAHNVFSAMPSFFEVNAESELCAICGFDANSEAVSLDLSMLKGLPEGATTVHAPSLMDICCTNDPSKILGLKPIHAGSDNSDDEGDITMGDAAAETCEACTFHLRKSIAIPPFLIAPIANDADIGNMILNAEVAMSICLMDRQTSLQGDEADTFEDGVFFIMQHLWCWGQTVFKSSDNKLHWRNNADTGFKDCGKWVHNETDPLAPATHRGALAKARDLQAMFFKADYQQHAHLSCSPRLECHLPSDEHFHIDDGQPDGCHH